MPSRAEIVAEARSWLGTPYRHQASAKGKGADCLGLVRGVYRAFFGAEPETVPPYTPDWNETGGEDLQAAASRHLVPIAIDALAEGDVALFRMKRTAPAKHAAILSSTTAMIHAYSCRAVCETALSAYWKRRLAFAFRFPGIA